MGKILMGRIKKEKLKISFDPNERREYLTGIMNAKNRRKKHNEKVKEEKAKQEKREARSAKKQVRREQAEIARDNFEKIEKIREDSRPNINIAKKTKKKKLQTAEGDDVDIQISY